MVGNEPERQPAGTPPDRAAAGAGVYAGLAVVALLAASVVFVLLADRSLRSPPTIPDVLRPTEAPVRPARTQPPPAVIPVTPEPIVIDLPAAPGPVERPLTPTAIPVRETTPARYFLVTVQPGDTLAAIASRYGYGFQEIAELNAIDDPYTIYVGDELLFPNRS